MKEKLEETKLLFHRDVAAIVPNPSIHADWYHKNWVCLYNYPFDIEMTFSFSNLVIEVLATLKISLRQLMPFAWRTLACLDAIESKHNLGIDVEVVKHSYSLKIVDVGLDL